MGWGSSTRRGGGRRVRAHPRKFVFLGFEGGKLGCSGNFAGMFRNPEVFEKLCKNGLCSFFGPY